MHPTVRNRLTNHPVRFPPMTVRPRRFLPAFALALLLTPGLRAQDGVVNTPPPPSDNPQDAQTPDQSDTVIKSRVNVVQVFFNVKDKHSALVPGLDRKSVG